MRKLTGYIGAMIIIFALMGSILAGYALNINGTSTVMNEYEKVTDVSGLYSHTQEPSYIDYNPASNYIGYNLDISTFDNPTGTHEYRIVENGVIKYRGSDRHILIDDVDQGVMSIARFYFISDKAMLYTEANGLTLYRYNGNNVVASLNDNATITIVNNNITVNIGGSNYSIPNNDIILVYATQDTDYYVSLSSGKSNVYLNDKDQFLAWMSGDNGILNGTTITGVNASYGTTSTANPFHGETVAAPGIYKYSSVGEPTGIFAVFYPITVNNGSGMGINYIESNRVNNYPVVRSDASTTTVTQQINPVITGTDYFPLNYVNSRPSDLRNLITIYTPEYHTNAGNVYTYGDYMCSPVDQTQGGNDISGTLHNFALSDIIANTNIPSNVETVTITTNGNTTTQTIYSWYHHDDPDSAIPLIVGTWSIDTNMCFINTRDDWVYIWL